MTNLKIVDDETQCDDSISTESSSVVPENDSGDPDVEEAFGTADGIVQKSPTEPKITMVESERDLSEVAEFFKGKSVFVTGGSGFLGKALVEKLLRSCPGISEVYLLMRKGRKGEEQSQRLKKLLSDSPFTYLKDHKPAALTKVHAVSGDVSAPDLGLSPEDRSLLASKVSVVFHSAANITFNASMAAAVATNLQGTRRVMQLCKEMPKLDCMVYVSTAFCNCQVEGQIPEEVLISPCEPEWLVKTVEEMDPKALKDATPKLLFGHPNTYTLTKMLAEKSIEKERGTIPVAIVRPSIVMGAMKEPNPGWVDNVNGASSFLAGALYGFFRGILAEGDVVADLVPSDLVVNHIITAAWDIAHKIEQSYLPDEYTTVGVHSIKSFIRIIENVGEDRGTCDDKAPLEVYHCTSGQVNPVTWGEFTSFAVQMARRNPCKGVIWYPAGKCRRSELRNNAAVALLHMFPAHVLQMFAKIKGDPAGSRLVRLQSAYSSGMKHSRFVTTRQWTFAGQNSASLSSRLRGVDRHLFPSDASAISWPSYIEDCVLGLRHFYFKQSPDTLPEARKAVKRLRWMHLFGQISIFLLALAFGAYVTGRWGVGSLLIAVSMAAVMRAL